MLWLIQRIINYIRFHSDEVILYNVLTTEGYICRLCKKRQINGLTTIYYGEEIAHFL